MCVLCAKALEAGWRCWVALLQSATPRSADDALVRASAGAHISDFCSSAKTGRCTDGRAKWSHRTARSPSSASHLPRVPSGALDSALLRRRSFGGGGDGLSMPDEDLLTGEDDSPVQRTFALSALMRWVLTSLALCAVLLGAPWSPGFVPVAAAHRCRRAVRRACAGRSRSCGAAARSPRRRRRRRRRGRGRRGGAATAASGCAPSSRTGCGRTRRRGRRRARGALPRRRRADRRGARRRDGDQLQPGGPGARPHARLPRLVRRRRAARRLPRPPGAARSPPSPASTPTTSFTSTSSRAQARSSEAALALKILHENRYKVAMQTSINTRNACTPRLS